MSLTESIFSDVAEALDGIGCPTEVTNDAEPRLLKRGNVVNSGREEKVTDALQINITTCRAYEAIELGCLDMLKRRV